MRTTSSPATCLSDFALFAAASDSQPAIEDAQQQQDEGSADACDEFGGYDSDVFDAMRQDSQSVIDDAMAATEARDLCCPRQGGFARVSGHAASHLSGRGQQFARCWHTGFRLFSDANFSGCECARQNRACTYILYCQGAHMPGTTLTYSEERRRKRRRSTYSACAASERRKHRKFCGAFGATHGNDFRKCFYHKKCR